MIDLNFIAEAIGHVALAYALVRIIPVLAAAALIAGDKMDKNDLKEIIDKTRRKKKW